MELIFKIMCIFAEINYLKVDFKEGFWEKHTWTKEQQEAFCDWFEDYIYYNKKAKKELFESPLNTRQWAKEATSWFILSYGFKCRE